MSSNSDASSTDSGSPSGGDPVSASVHMIGLRLWVVCAVLIVAYAVTNYFLNLFAK